MLYKIVFKVIFIIIKKLNINAQKINKIRSFFVTLIYIYTLIGIKSIRLCFYYINLIFMDSATIQDNFIQKRLLYKSDKKIDVMLQ